MKISNGILKKSAALSAAALLGGATLPKAEGAVLTSMSQYDNSKALSANPMYKWSAAVKRTDVELGSAYASAVMIAPDLFITAGHVTPRNGSLVASLTEIVLGANYNTSTDRYGVSHTERYPGYIFGNTTTIDLGVGWTTGFVNGFDLPTTFASFSNVNTLTVAEYGNYGDLTTGELSSIGDRLAGNARISTASGSYPPGTYFTTRFDGPGSADPLNVGLTNFGSGSPWWTEDGYLSGMSIASSNGIFNGGYTVALNLTDPTVQAYLQPLIDDSWARYNASIPEPTTLALATLGVGAMALRRRRKE